MSLAADEATTYDVVDRSVAQLQADLSAGRVTSLRIVQAYLARIEALDRRGPALHAVLQVNPNASTDATALDDERREGKVRGPLHGIPILIKDNIETSDPMPTTAGSLALRTNITKRDSPSVARLRAAGAIVLGKTNLSEWANYRDGWSSNGWSGLGGLTRNPHVLDRDPCGSSSGSAVAVSASLGAVAVGTETNGSIVCPSSMNGIVGLKPTVGLVSRTFIVPIGSSQDTAGPMGRSVSDVALLLTAMAGTDTKDAATTSADARKKDYTTFLKADALKGQKIGRLRYLATGHPATDMVESGAIAALKSAGATVVDIDMGPAARPDTSKILLHEFKKEITSYLASSPAPISVRSLADLIAFNKSEARRELGWFGQDIFEQSLAETMSEADYNMELAAQRKIAGADGIDALLKTHGVAALVTLTTGPAGRADEINGSLAIASASGFPAVAGYPHITVPAGRVQSLPLGLSFIGPAWSEGTLIGFAHAFETATKARVQPKFVPTLQKAVPNDAAWRPVQK